MLDETLHMEKRENAKTCDVVHGKKTNESKDSESLTVKHIFLVLITTCLLVLLWRNLWLLVVVTPIVSWTMFKKFLPLQFADVLSAYKNFTETFKSLLDKSIFNLFQLLSSCVEILTGGFFVCLSLQ